MTGLLNLTSTNTNGPIPANLPIGLYAVFGTIANKNAAGSAAAGATVTTPYLYLLQNALSIIQYPTAVSPYPGALTFVVTVNYTANVTGNGDYLSTDTNQIVMLCRRSQ